MPMVEICPVEYEEFPMLADWLVSINQQPEQHCLHSWSGQNSTSLCQQLMTYYDDGELIYLAAWQSGQLVGALGAEYDESLDRGWLHGPHVLTADWHNVADQLYTRILTELPEAIDHLDTYLNVENERGREFYRQHGFKERDRYNCDFRLTRADHVQNDQSLAVNLTEKQRASFIELFERLFPNAYYRAERVVDMGEDSHQVFIIPQDDTVLGFAVVSVEGDGSIGEVQFFGVHEQHRQQGYGKQLLQSAINWLLDEAGVEMVTINVSEDLEHARALYESVGFRLWWRGIGLRKDLPAQS